MLVNGLGKLMFSAPEARPEDIITVFELDDSIFETRAYTSRSNKSVAPVR